MEIYIPYLICKEDKYKNIPIEFSLHSPRKFKLLLDNRHKFERTSETQFLKDNLNHKNGLGNTITHHMAYDFQRFNVKYLQNRKAIVESLIPYFDIIKNNFEEQNIYGKRPIDIIESRIRMKFGTFIHHIVSIDLLQQSGSKMKVYSNYKSSSSYVPNTKSEISFEVKYANKKEYMYSYDNRKIFFSPEVLKEVNNIERLGGYTKNIIHGLLPEIIYCDLDDYGKVLSHLSHLLRFRLKTLFFTLNYFLKNITFYTENQLYRFPLKINIKNIF
ncbi:hypothetical protein [Cardinium endosymbiont of Bemisia tabaci]|uniref:hypothetical protein n=1 Tax=Cardinium endosymbiont of Bemisia tabaci TaxID=672794 RepID=UPI000442D176|nr:hypothetical protein [Cardinium endosymbiont of Bemisia tabaci]CDG49808.1 Hypothetical protein CHV_a0500 [Cardinium endosymbiont cBtQ1 of Bemisia tabaci]